MSNAGKLLPCPFCGGKAYFRTDTIGYQGNYRSFNFHIECKDCKIALPNLYDLSFFLDENGDLCFKEDEREKAIFAWNKSRKLDV